MRERPRFVTVLAGGWSASQCDLERLPGIVIGVNDAGLLAPRVDRIVSMDRLWTEHRFDQLEALGKPSHIRRCALINLDNALCNWLQPFYCDHNSITLSDSADTLNGTHSGFCALNLAYQLRPLELLLVGFDLKRGPKDEAHWFPQYPWVQGHASSRGKLTAWSQQFAVAGRQLAKAGIKASIVGTHSAVRGFATINPAAMRSLCDR